MAPALEIANYRVSQRQKQFEEVVKDFIFMRRHKQMKIQKPQLDFDADDKTWYNPNNFNRSLNFFKTQQEQNQQEQRTNKILLSRSFKPKIKLEKLQNKKQLNQYLNDGNYLTIIKSKIIKKVVGSKINQQKQRQAQKSYCKYLLNYLHKSNLLLIHHQVPPTLSVLQTIDDGDYLKDGQRKDFPHYSHVIQPIDLPPVMKQKARIIRQPVKMDLRNHFFSIEDNTVFKVKHVYLMVEKLFQQSIRNCSMIRQLNFKGDDSLRLQNENHDFLKLAEIIGVNFRTSKLLYDSLNDHYDLQKQLSLGRSDDYKSKVCRQILELIKKQMKQYFDKKKTLNETLIYSCFTPLQEYYLSLKDLNIIFMQVHNKVK